MTLCGFSSQSRAPVAMSANSKSAGSSSRRAAAVAEREAREAREAREMRAQARAGLKEEIHLPGQTLGDSVGMDSFSEEEGSDASIQLISEPLDASSYPQGYTAPLRVSVRGANGATR